jgi:hypothetical protein
MDLLLDILKNIPWMLFWFVVLFVVALFTLPGGGNRRVCRKTTPYTSPQR